MGGKSDPLGIVQEIEIDHMHNPKSIPKNETHKPFWEFGIQTDHLISTRRPDLVSVNKKKKRRKTWWIMDFALLADHRVKIKES